MKALLEEEAEKISVEEEIENQVIKLSFKFRSQVYRHPRNIFKIFHFITFTNK